jgi:hypothetical protein
MMKKKATKMNRIKRMMANKIGTSRMMTIINRKNKSQKNKL